VIRIAVLHSNPCSRLEEFLRRRTRLQRVEEAVRRNVVVGFFNTMYWSRRFRRHLEAKRNDSRMVSVPQFSVPEIYVEGDEDEHQESYIGRRSVLRSPPVERSNSTRELSAHGPAITTETPSDTPLSSPPRSPTRSEWSHTHASLSPSARPTSSNLYDGAPGDDEPGERRENSVIVQDVMDSLDNSAWGESIRRSFTIRRSPSNNAGR
jgi:hypothetical protein